MNKSEVQALNEEIMNLFRGLMQGSVGYKVDNLHCAMKVSVCEVFNDVAEDFVMSVMSGKEITTDQLQMLHDNLLSFGEEFEVKEATILGNKVKDIIKQEK